VLYSRSLFCQMLSMISVIVRWADRGFAVIPVVSLKYWRSVPSKQSTTTKWICRESFAFACPRPSICSNKIAISRAEEDDEFESGMSTRC